MSTYDRKRGGGQTKKKVSRIRPNGNKTGNSKANTRATWPAKKQWLERGKRLAGKGEEAEGKKKPGAEQIIDGDGKVGVEGVEVLDLQSIRQLICQLGGVEVLACKRPAPHTQRPAPRRQPTSSTGTTTIRAVQHPARTFRCRAISRRH